MNGLFNLRGLISSQSEGLSALTERQDIIDLLQISRLNTANNFTALVRNIFPAACGSGHSTPAQTMRRKSARRRVQQLTFRRLRRCGSIRRHAKSKALASRSTPDHSRQTMMLHQGPSIQQPQPE